MVVRLLPTTTDLLNYTDPDETGLHMVLAPDLMAQWGSTEAVRRALENLDAVLAEPSFSTADLKGALNRASHRTWGTEYARAFTPREFLEEFKIALEIFLRR